MSKKLLVPFMILVLFSGLVSLSAQVVIWEETFSPNPTDWELEGNWSFMTDYLRLNWTPSVPDYDFSAISPVIPLPDETGDLIISQYYYDFSAYDQEMLEIIIIHGDEETVLWEYDTIGGNWGVLNGEDIEFSLVPFAGEDIQIRFRSYGGTTYNMNNWNIYNITIMGSIDNDLAALSLTGPSTPSVGMEVEYTVLVRNNGVLTQDDYTVRLMQGEDTELYSVDGLEIEHGEEIPYVFTHTFTEQGPTYLWGEVVFDEDEMPGNNTTPNLSVMVMEEGIIFVQIGEHASTSNLMPFSFNWGNSISQTVYFAEEFNYDYGVISAIEYYNNFVSEVQDSPIKIWMAQVFTDEIPGGYLPFHHFTEVFDGNISFPSGENSVIIPLQEEFNYAYGNLVVMANKPMGTAYNTSDHFYYSDTTGQPNRTRRNASTTIEYFPDSLPVGTTYARIPNTGFYFSELIDLQDDMAALAISGNSTPSVGVATPYTVTVKNIGANTQDDYTIRIMNTDGLELVSQDFTTPLEQLEEMDFEVFWTPQEVGEMSIYAEIVLDGDEIEQNNTTPTMNVSIQPEGAVVITIGTDDTSANFLPLNFFFRNNLSQVIYMADELNIGGMVTGISYYNNFITDLTEMPVKIWIAETEQTDLSAGWLDFDEFTQVFDGTRDFPSGQNLIHIPFSEPFLYSGSNLVVMANRPMDTQYYSSSDHFFYTETPDYPNRARRAQSDSIDLDPELGYAQAGILNSRVPNTSLHFVTEGMGALTGTVSDIDDEPISGAQVSIVGTNYTTMSNAAGVYTFPYLPEGLHNLSATKFGYQDYLAEDIEVIEDETTTHNITMLQLENVTVSGQVVGSDYPDVGLSEAIVSLTGYENYNTETDDNGFFTIPGVYTDQTYNLTVVVAGYSTLNQEVYVGFEDLDLGAVIVNEVAYPPYGVVATQNPDDTEVDLIWNSPLQVDYYFSDFEMDDGGWVATADWDPVGDWEWTNTYDVDNFETVESPASTVPPPTAYSGTGLWGTVMYSNHTNAGGFSFLSQTFDFSSFNNTVLDFWSWNNAFGAWDYGQIRVNGDLVWGPEWDHPNTSWQNVIIDLSAYDGETDVEVVFEFFATTVVAYAGWYIDDVYIGPATDFASRNNQQFDLASSFSSPQRDDSRVLENYRVYRFLYEDAGNEDNWIELATVTDTTYTDLTWADVDTGFYHYAVKAIYTNDVPSNPAISNWVAKDMTTNVTVNITTDVGDSAEGAIATLYYLDTDPDGNSPVYSVAAEGDDPSVATLNNVLIGNYDLEVTMPGFSTFTLTNVLIDEPMVFDVQIDEIPYPPENLHYTAGSEIVNLMWDPPGFLTRSQEEIDELVSHLDSLQQQGIMSKEEVSAEVERIVNEYDYADSRALLGYNIYRDGVQLNTELLNVTNYTDTDVVNQETYVYYVTAVYTLAESEPSNSVTVVPGPQQLIQIGTDTTSANTLPFNFFWRNSLTQTIYMQNEINAAGLITQLEYYNNFTTNLPNMPVQIWMGETTQSNLTDGWIPAGEMEMVFDGNVDFPIGENTIVIELDEFFLYTGASNLVIMAKRVMDTQYYSSLDHFYYTATDHDNRSRNMHSDSIDYDPYAPSGGTLTNRVPNTGINILTAGMGSLMGYVHNEDDQPIQGATVSVLETPFQTQTDANGYYFFGFVFEGEQEVMASAHGYYDSIEEVEIFENETSEQDFTLNYLPMVTVTGTVVGSDFPDVGLEDAQVILDGYDYYETMTDGDGEFTLTNVYADQQYQLTVIYPGYAIYQEMVDIGNVDQDLGTVIVDEIAFPPSGVTAELLLDATVEITWNSPGTAVMTEFRYDDGEADAQLGFGGGTANSVLGAAHRREAEIHEVTWYTTSEGGPHNTVNLFIFGLNAQGNPNSNDILYQASNIPNQDNQWNVYELAEPVEAPDGFLIGLSYSGFLGLAVDDGVGAPWDFVPNTQYGTSDYTSVAWTPIEQWGFEVNYLIRAFGFDYGPARTGDVRIVSERLDSTERRSDGIKPTYIGMNQRRVIETSPDYNLGRNTSALTDRSVRDERNQGFRDRALELYTVFRMAEGQENNENLWVEIGTATVPDTTIIDTGFAELGAGSYRYAVKAVYTNNVISEPAFSNLVLHDMYAQVTMNITTNSGDTPTGAVVTLTNHDEDPDHVYSASSPPSGIVIFPSVWKGLYHIQVEKQGFETYIAESVEITENIIVYNLQLIEAVLPVVNLTYTVEGNNVLLEWDEPWADDSALITETNQKQGKTVTAEQETRGFSAPDALQLDNSKDSSRALLNYVVYRNDTVIANNVTNLHYADQDLQEGFYVYGVQAVYTTGTSEIVYTDTIEISNVGDESIIVYDTELRSNYPNPFNPDTIISFTLREDAKVAIEIFNVKGQMIRTLVKGEFEAGAHRVLWNGRTDFGSEAGSGIYFYRMTTPDYVSTQKMILMK